MASNTSFLIDEVNQREKTILALQNEIKLKPIRSSNLFSVSLTASDPRISALVVNTLIKQYLQYRTEIYRPQAELNFIKEKQQFYEKQLADQQAELNRVMQERATMGVTTDDTKLDDLRAAIVYTSKLNQDYLDKLTEIQSSSSLYLTKIIDVRAVETAVPTWSPVGPHRLENILLAIPLGLIGGLALAMIRESLGSAFHTPEEAAAKLDTTVLATIPEIGRGRNTQKAVDESCGYIHSRLQSLQTKPGQPIVVFTSGIKGAGVSTMARCYAVFAARHLGIKTLLVDANITEPEQHQLARVKGAPGFTDVLIKREEFAKAVVSGGVDNLFLLPAGNALNIIPTPEQLVAWRAIARQDYQLIVIDAPPASVGFSLFLCTIATSVIFMARMHFGDSQTILSAYQALRESKAPLVGLLANRKLL